VSWLYVEYSAREGTNNFSLLARSLALDLVENNSGIDFDGILRMQHELLVSLKG
jgi:hypothetical protein